MSWSRGMIAISLFVEVMPASAQSARRQAEELYDNGRALVAAGKIAEACVAFEQSQKLEPAVTTLIALGTCREMLGQLATAWELFLEAERQSRSASDDTTMQLHKIALDRAARLEPRVPKLTINVPENSKLDRLEILRDQEIVPAEKWNLPLSIDGGTYTITARAPGANDWSTRVTVAYGSNFYTVDIPDLRSVGRALDERPKLPAALDPADTVRRRGIALPIVVGAGAVALLGGALGFSLWGNSTYDDAKSEMVDQTRRDSLEASANRKRYAAQALAVAGIGCAGVAAWLYFLQRGARLDTTSARAAHLILAPTTSGIGVIGQF